MVIIFWLSHQSGDHTGIDLSWLFPENPPPWLGIDKIAHFMLYAILGLLALRAHPRQPYPCFLFCLMYGLSDEVHQTFVPLRQFELLDLCADALGSACAISTSSIMFRREKEPRKV